MSVQKFIKRKAKDNFNFTVIPNNPLQKLKNYEALGLYAYIVSLPEEWEFNKKQLAEHGNIGRDKINKLIKLLERHQLIEIIQHRKEDGKFGEFDMIVYDGTNFKPLENNEINDYTEPLTEKPLTANQLLENSTYKRNIDKVNKKQKIKREPERKKRVPLSEDFLPDEKMKARLEEVSMKAGLSSQELLLKFIAVCRAKQKLSGDWNAELDLFLLRERPSVQIPNKSSSKIGYNNDQRRQEPSRHEIRSTVKDYVPVSFGGYAKSEVVEENMAKIKHLLSGKMINAQLQPKVQPELQPAPRQFGSESAMGT